jgi:hypothetical protein
MIKGSKKPKAVFLAAFLLILVALGVVFFIQKDRNNKTETVQPGQEALLGGDKDEHGCIGSAGYTWCEVKGKCLRRWEEPCEAQEPVAEIIKALLVEKNNWNPNDIKVTVSENDGQYATGGVGSETPQGGGGLWFAAKVGGEWKIVYDGNGIISCDALTDYPDFPSSMIPECYDYSAEKMVQR